jgi:hypothetical protein
MKRIFLMMAALMLAMVLALNAGAEELPIVPEVTVDPSTGTVDESSGALPPVVDEGSLGGEPTVGEPFPEFPEIPEGEDGTGEQMSEVFKTWTGKVIDWIYAHRNDITSAFGAAAFAVYAFLYKRKLVPSVDGLKTGVVSTMTEVIGNIQGAVDKFSTTLTAQQNGWVRDIEAIAAHLKQYETVLEETRAQQREVLSLEQRLAESDARTALFCTAMRAQVEMIHQTLSSACLPDEQHEANHKAYLHMLAMIEEAEANMAVLTADTAAEGTTEEGAAV